MFAIDMTSLIKDDSFDIAEFINKYIDSFKKDVNDRINKII